MTDDDSHVARLTAALRRAQADAQRAQEVAAETAQQLESLVDILVQAGTLKPGHTKMLKRIAQGAQLARAPKLELSAVEDKYTVEGDPAVDCAARLHLCQARCCSFGVVLSKQDLVEGEVAWDIDHPYRLPRLADGYCTYIERDAPGGGCTNYQVRPATCRSYTCREDARVWIDFEAMIPAPMPELLVPLRRRK